jgi:hypothetical protein
MVPNGLPISGGAKRRPLQPVVRPLTVWDHSASAKRMSIALSTS